MYYTIYQITNTVNQKIYIGKHQTNKLDDSYMGSGVALRKAIRIYGVDKFVKKILIILNNENEMNTLEKMVITEEFCRRKDVYNEMVGGEGGGNYWKGKHHSKETIEKLRQMSMNKSPTEEQRKKMSENQRRIWTQRRQNPIEYKKYCESVSKGKRANMKSHEQPQETRRKISESLKRYYDRVGRKHPEKQTYYFREIKTNQPLSGKRIKVWKDTQEFAIHVEEIDWYLNNGWSLGRRPTNKKPLALTPEAKFNSSGKGKYIVHNQISKKVKRIEKEELGVYLSNGWIRGYPNKKWADS